MGNRAQTISTLRANLHFSSVWLIGLSTGRKNKAIISWVLTTQPIKVTTQYQVVIARSEIPRLSARNAQAGLSLRGAKRRSNLNEVATPAFGRFAMTKEQAPQSNSWRLLHFVRNDNLLNLQNPQDIE